MTGSMLGGLIKGSAEPVFQQRVKSLVKNSLNIFDHVPSKTSAVALICSNFYSVIIFGIPAIIPCKFTVSLYFPVFSMAEENCWMMHAADGFLVNKNGICIKQCI